MRHRIILCGLGFGFVTASACGLDPVGEGPAAVPSGSSDGLDGSVVVPDDDTGAATPANCTTSSPPCTSRDGWQPVALALDDSEGCPDGYTALDLSEASLDKSQEEACECDPAASTTDPPSCDEQNDYPIIGGIDTSVQTKCLGALPTTVSVNGAHCTQFQPNSLSSTWDALRASPIEANAGACSPQCKAVPEAFTTKAVRVCVPTAGCTDAACREATAGTRTSTFAYCMMKDGDDLECPGGSPTLVPRVIGESPKVECSGATCRNNVTCAPPMLSLFTDQNCSTSAYAFVPADGNCNRPGKRGLLAFEYKSDLTNNPTMDVLPTASVAYANNTKTLCCPK